MITRFSEHCMSKLRRMLGAASIALSVAVCANSLRAEPMRGAALYAAECAGCHGTRLEGQPRWWQVTQEGRLPAPPLDASGHVWQHSDAELLDIIVNGMANVAGPDYRSDMPAFGSRLNRSDMQAVLTFIKAQWPVGMRAVQAVLNPGSEAALVELLDQDGDWTFPPDCLTPVQRATALTGSGSLQPPSAGR